MWSFHAAVLQGTTKNCTEVYYARGCFLTFSLASLSSLLKVPIAEEAELLLCIIIGKPYDDMESKMAPCRKFKSENRR